MRRWGPSNGAEREAARRDFGEGDFGVAETLPRGVGGVAYFRRLRRLGGWAGRRRRRRRWSLFIAFRSLSLSFLNFSFLFFLFVCVCWELGGLSSVYLRADEEKTERPDVSLLVGPQREDATCQ